MDFEQASDSADETLTKLFRAGNSANFPPPERADPKNQRPRITAITIPTIPIFEVSVELSFSMQQFLYFLPLPQGQGAFLLGLSDIIL